MKRSVMNMNKKAEFGREEVIISIILVLLLCGMWYSMSCLLDTTESDIVREQLENISKDVCESSYEFLDLCEETFYKSHCLEELEFYKIKYDCDEVKVKINEYE